MRVDVQPHRADQLAGHHQRHDHHLLHAHPGEQRLRLIRQQVGTLRVLHDQRTVRVTQRHLQQRVLLHVQQAAQRSAGRILADHAPVHAVRLQQHNADVVDVRQPAELLGHVVQQRRLLSELRQTGADLVEQTWQVHLPGVALGGALQHALTLQRHSSQIGQYVQHLHALSAHVDGHGRGEHHQAGGGLPGAHRHEHQRADALPYQPGARRLTERRIGSHIGDRQHPG